MTLEYDHERLLREPWLKEYDPESLTLPHSNLSRR